MKEGWQLFKKSALKEDLMSDYQKLKKKGWPVKITKKSKGLVWDIYRLWVYTFPSMAKRLKGLI